MRATYPLELRGIGLTYADAATPVLRDVDLGIEEGELLLVCGPTGAGKSTLLGVLTGLVPRFSGGRLTGRVLLDGVDVTTSPPRERVHAVGYVGQDPAAGFVTDTVEEELAYGMEQLGLEPDTMRRRVEETLDLLGIADLRDRVLTTLSGGQQQRVAIGAVLTMHPRVLVLDEPTSALDPTAAEEVLATLTRLVHDLGVAVVLAEHRLERVVPYADRVALVAGDGTVTVAEPAAAMATSPVAPPLVQLGRRLGWQPLPLTVREARRAVRGRTVPAAGPVVRPPAGADETVLAARDLTVVLGGRAACREVDLTLPAGRVAALMGRNGAGKSTLLWALQGTRRRAGGHLDVDGRDPAALTPAGRRGLVGLLPQTASDLLYLETVGEECAAGGGPGGGPGGGAEVRELLDRFAPGVPDDRHPRDLSEGQRLALALALVLAARPRVVLLDEPTRGLDYAAKAALATTLRELADEGHAVLVATHDVEFTALAADDVVVMAEGEVVASGPVREVVAQSPAFAPQVTKIVGAPWLWVDEVVAWAQ